jgi:Snare region anchored in the vesicle membrane C-terminus
MKIKKLSEPKAARLEYTNQIKSALILSEDTINIADASLLSLEKQRETIEGINHTLDANDSMLDKSLKLLRGMTWTGAILNWVEDTTKSTSQINKATNHKHLQVINHSNESLEPLYLELDPLHEEEVDKILTTSTSNLPLNSCSDYTDNNAEQLYESVKELRLYADNLSTSIKHTTKLLDQVAIKQDITLERTYELSNKTTQMHKAIITTPMLILNNIGLYEFTGRYVSYYIYY